MKKIVSVRSTHARHWVGDGFPVRSIFSYNDAPEELSPFLLLDYAGPTEFSPTKERRGVGEHPHRGFETVTIVYSGEVEHRDSAGGGGLIGPGDIQWMTAGAGIVHDEFHGAAFARQGGTFELIQLWVNLPAKHKMTAPGYQGIRADQVPCVALPDDAGSVRVIAGTLADHAGPAHSFSPINLWEIRVKAGHRVELTVPPDYTTLLFVMKGKVAVGDGLPSEGLLGEGLLSAAELGILEKEGESVVFTAREDSTLMLLNGEPLNEPVVGYGPFVMNSQREIQKAFADYQSGLMGRVAAAES